MAVKTRKRKSLKGIKKLSTLLALGLRDLKKQERGKTNEVRMSRWWEPRGDGRTTCTACLAGSVMKYGLVRPRKTLGLIEVDPWCYDDDTKKRLLALNGLRMGWVDEASARMDLRTSLKDRCIIDYHTHRERWWKSIKQLLADLKAAGE